MKVYRTARKIVIELPLSVLPKALHAAPFNMDPDGDPAYHITDKRAFADAMVDRLGEEEEDGTTPLHRLFDTAMEAVIENGDEGVEEYRRSERRRERDQKAAIAQRKACRECGDPADHEHVPLPARDEGGKR